jgi:hypothetical protein
MLFSPILSYITYGLMGKDSITYYFQVFVIFWGVIFILIKNIKIHLSLVYYFLIAYILYVITWSFFNGLFAQKGLFNDKNLANISILSIIIIIYNTKFTDKFIKNFLFLSKLTIILAVTASIIQVFNSNFLNVWERYNDFSPSVYNGDTYTDRRTSIFGYINPNEIGLSFIPLLSVTVGLLYFNNDKKYFLFLIFGGIIAILSNSRYVIVGYIIISLILLKSKNLKMSLIKYFLISFALFIILMQGLSYLGYDFNAWYENRLFAEGSIYETTRYKAWGNFVKFFPENIFWGTGVNMTNEIEMASNAIGSSQVHVGYLAHLLSFGIIGSFLLFGFWFLLARKLYKNAKKTMYWGSFFAFSTFLWSNFTLVYYSIFFYGIIFAFVIDKYLIDREMRQIQNK